MNHTYEGEEWKLTKFTKKFEWKQFLHLNSFGTGSQFQKSRTAKIGITWWYIWFRNPWFIESIMSSYKRLQRDSSGWMCLNISNVMLAGGNYFWYHAHLQNLFGVGETLRKGKLYHEKNLIISLQQNLMRRHYRSFIAIL